MASPSSFNPERDIPSLKGKVIVVTGATSGIGRETVRYLAAHEPEKLYLAARNKAKGEETIKDIEASVPGAKVHLLELDLSSLASVAAAAAELNSQNTRLDLLINNAGTMSSLPSLSADGYEIQFATNHMGHFLLTRQLLPLLRSTAAAGADVRIVNLSSGAHAMAPKGGWAPELATYDMADYYGVTRYGQSKLANIFFTTELARRYPEITSVAVHPGGVATNFGDNFMKQNRILGTILGFLMPIFAKTPAQGAWNSVWTSVAPLEKDAGVGKGVKQGEYYEPVGKGGNQSKVAKDGEVAKRLWEWSEEQVKEKGY